MAPPTYLVLHKKEWERIKRQGRSLPEEPVQLKNEYLQALTEMSREWMKTWPDTVAGHIAQLEKKKEDEHKANIAFMKAYTHQTKQDASKPIKEAKQLIFENTCYGRKLLSALLESRAIDVREVQIKLRKDIQQREAEIEKQQEEARQHLGMNDLHNKDAEREKAKKTGFLECVKFNKNIATLKKKEKFQNMLKEKQEVIEDKKFLKDVLQNEKIQKEAMNRCVQMEIKKVESEKKEIEKIKDQEKALDDALIEIHNKAHDRITYKSRAVLKKIHQGRPDRKWSKELFKQVEKLQHEEMKRYDEFVEKGIKALNERVTGKETRDNLQEKEKRSTRLLISQQNKKMGEEVTIAKKFANKCSCCRETLCLNAKKIGSNPEGKFKKTDVDPTKITEIKPGTGLENTKKNIDQKSLERARTDTIPKKHLFLEPRNQLLEDLKKRAKEPSGWNGTKAAHVQFAQQANNVLKEIKHKYFARKVVDEYRKTNCLDDTTLPVPDY